MYKCGKCGAKFRAPKVEMVKRELVGKTSYEATETCPKCGDEDVFVTARCGACGRWEASEFDDWCRDCVDIADAEVKKCISAIGRRTGASYPTAVKLFLERTEYYNE